MLKIVFGYLTYYKCVYFCSVIFNTKNMQTQVKVTKNENGLLYNVVNLNFDDYYLVREAVTSKIFQLENRIESFSASSDVFDEEYLSEMRYDLENYKNLLKKL